MTSSFRSFSSNIEVSVVAALVIVSHEWLVPRKVKSQTTRSRTEEKYKEKLLPTRKAVLKGWNSFICRGKTNWTHDDFTRHDKCIRQMRNVEREKKHNLFVDIFCVILALLKFRLRYSFFVAMRFIQKWPVFGLSSSFVVERTLFFFVVLNSSFSSRTSLFFSIERRSPKSNESRAVTAISRKISEPDEKSR